MKLPCQLLHCYRFTESHGVPGGDAVHPSRILSAPKPGVSRCHVLAIRRQIGCRVRLRNRIARFRPVTLVWILHCMGQQQHFRWLLHLGACHHRRLRWHFGLHSSVYRLNWGEISAQEDDSLCQGCNPSCKPSRPRSPSTSKAPHENCKLCMLSICYIYSCICGII